jgi:hypothetical protein
MYCRVVVTRPAYKPTIPRLFLFVEIAAKQGTALATLEPPWPIWTRARFKPSHSTSTRFPSNFSTGKATEHSYRPALAKLLGDLLPKFTITNEPSRIQCGAPDYIIAKGKGATSIPVAFVEAKDIGDSDLDGNRQHKEQFNRYKNSLDHILFTDYLDFHLYENGMPTQNIRIAEIKGNKIALIEANVPMFLGMVAAFAEAHPQTITSSTKLAQMMAAKARLLAEVIEKTLETDSEKTGELAGQWKSFQKVLIHDLTERQFADIYAQTICYGMFAARLHDDTPDTFSREEAASLIPKTNPFLRKVS